MNPDTALIGFALIAVTLICTYYLGYSAAKSEKPVNKVKQKPYNPAADY